MEEGLAGEFELDVRHGFTAAKELPLNGIRVGLRSGWNRDQESRHVVEMRQDKWGLMRT